MCIWCLVADKLRARVVEARGLRGNLCEIESYFNPTGRQLNQDFETDRPGRSIQGQHRRTALEDRESSREREEMRFAKRIATRLNEAFRRNEFDRLGMVAAPKMLGRIRKYLSPHVEHVLVGTSSKNITTSLRDDITEHIRRTILA